MMIENAVKKIAEKVKEWFTKPTQHRQAVWVPVPVRSNMIRQERPDWSNISKNMFSFRDEL